MPSYETLVIRFVAEPTTRMIEFETGEADIILNLSGTDIDRMEQTPIEGATLHKLEGLNVYRFSMNTELEKLKDLRVRQAIAHAVDWEAVAKNAYGSSGNYASSILASSVTFYQSQGVYEYDVDLAKQLMKDAGYENGFDLVTYITANTDDAKAMELVQAYLSQIGINLKINLTDKATMIGANRSGEAEISIGNTTALGGDPDSGLNPFYPDSSSMVDRQLDDVLSEMLRTGVTITDNTKRSELYGEIQSYIYENVLVIPIINLVVASATWDYIDEYPAVSSNMLDFKYITLK